MSKFVSSKISPAFVSLFIFILGSLLTLVARADDTVPATRTVSVLVCYTDAAAAAAGSTGSDNDAAIKSEINRMIADGNSAFDASDINARFHLAAAMRTSYAESNASRNSYSKDLENIAAAKPESPTPALAEIAKWREEYCADLVVLLRAGAGTDSTGAKGIAGLSYLLETEYLNNGSSSYTCAFSVVGLNLNVYTMAHELGHSLGCGHEVDPSIEHSGMHDYSHGYVYTVNGSKRGTIMAYGGTAQRRFSNPNITDSGVATGDGATADNARTINENIEAVAAYREPNRTAAAPVFSTNIQPDADGVYWGNVTITLTSETPYATIKYKKGEDGSTGTYVSGISINSVTTGVTEVTVYAWAERDGFNTSETVSLKIKVPATATDQIRIAGKEATDSSWTTFTNGKAYSADSAVSLKFSAYNIVTSGRKQSETAASDGVVIRYTLDGSEVTGDSLAYDDASPVVLPDDQPQVYTIRARAFLAGYLPGAEFTNVIVIGNTVAAAPVLSANGGVFANSAVVSISSETDGAKIYYRIAGNRWDAPNYLYSGEELEIDSSLTLETFTYQSYYDDSETVSSTFTILDNAGILDAYGNRVAAGANRSNVILNGTLLAAGDGTGVDGAGFGGIATNVINVAAGRSQTLYTTDDFALYLLLVGKTPSTGATKITTGELADTQVLLIASGANHALFTTATNDLYGFGDNSRGQLGVAGDGADISTVPVKIRDNVLLVAAGPVHSLFVTCDGRLFGMGANDCGQLGDAAGDEDDEYSLSTPVEIAGDIAITPPETAAGAPRISIAAGAAHSLFIKSDGSVWSLGCGADGQLGDGSFANRAAPAQVAENAIAVAAGDAHSLILKADGTVWAAGDNSAGQLGAPSAGTASAVFVQAALPAGSRAVAIAAGARHSVVLLDTDVILTFGDNSAGQLGISEGESASAPETALVKPSFAVQPESASVREGSWHALTVEVVGSGPFTYQWFRTADGSPGSEVALEGETAAALAFQQFTTTDEGFYFVRVTGADGEADSDLARLTVSRYDSYALTSKGAKLDAKPLLPAGTLYVVGGKPVFTWSVKNVVTGEFEEYRTAAGKTVTGSSLTVKADGTYRVVVTWKTVYDAAEQCATKEWAVQVFPVLKFDAANTLTFTPTIPLETPVKNGIIITPENEVTFRARLATAPEVPVIYRWFDGKTPIAVTGQSTLGLPTFSQSDELRYTPTAKSKISVTVETEAQDSRERALSIAKSKTLAVKAVLPPAVKITNKLTAGSDVLTVRAGKSLTLKTKTTGTAKFTYQWLKDGVQIPNATKSSYALKRISADAAGTYTVHVTNPTGERYTATADIKIVVE